MRRSRNIRPIAIAAVLAILALTGLAILAGQLRLVRMNTRSMQLDSAASEGVSVRRGDLALVSKRLGGPLRRGTLVVVDLSKIGLRVTTIRRVAAVPGDKVPDSNETNGMTTIPPGYYYLVGTSTNAIDSRQLGPIAADRIISKVLLVFK